MTTPEQPGTPGPAFLPGARLPTRAVPRWRQGEPVASRGSRRSCGSRWIGAARNRDPAMPSRGQSFDDGPDAGLLLAMTARVSSAMPAAMTPGRILRLYASSCAAADFRSAVVSGARAGVPSESARGLMPRTAPAGKK
jgi:hypothetical protein